MKKMKYILSILLIINLTGCHNFLEEENLSGRTADTYYGTSQGFEDLIKSNYSTLRSIALYHGLYFLGTDLFSSYGTTDNNGLNLYNSQLNSSLGDVDAYWKQLYYSIGIVNSSLVWADKVSGLTSTTLNYRIGEVKALRAYYYFLLVETFGDVPLVLEPTTSPTFGWQRTPEKDVYTQIIKDLTDAMNVLPATTADFGRVTKGMAQHLLAKVYLTRGYKSYGGGNSDFTQAANLATDLITNGGYSLVTSYSKLFDPTVSGFQKNTEIIFSVQYSTTTASNGAGNYLQQLYLWDTQSITPIGRSAFYNKPNYVCSPTPFFFSNFDKTNDSRYSATVWDAIMAQTSGSLTRSLDNQKLSFVAGDTVIYYPATAWTDAQKLTKKYFVINPDEYRKNFFTLSRSYPEFKKFRDPSVTSFTDGGGTRDTYIFRLGETYLIAAEAYLKLGDPKALIYFNAVRTRAAKSGKELAMQASSITIDDILDERARELSGEEFRWFELKRTGKLIERVIAHNEEASAANSSGIDAHYLLRPIPQSQIDLNRGDFPQNSKY